MCTNKSARKPAPEHEIRIAPVVDALRRVVEAAGMLPYVTVAAQGGRDPFHILVSTLLSLRTRDQATAQASEALLARASTPRAMLALSVEQVAEAIRPVLYYNNKARTILDICRRLADEYGGRVPDTIEELLTFKGVGRKTANLVVTLGFGKPGICVDTHVHRISNRLWAIGTKTPEQTETWLRDHLPGEYWIGINTWMVAFGQSLCHPTSPWCSKCPLRPDCQRWGVARSR
jgi:endonuclease-3